MTRSYITRVAAAAAALLFASLGGYFWLFPASAAARLGLAVAAPGGLTALRADVGGLFLGLALLCGAAFRTRQRPWFLAAAALLGAVATGRLVGMLLDGPSAGDGLALGAEAGLALLLVTGSRAMSTRIEGPTRRSRRWLVAAGSLVATLGAAFAAIMLSPQLLQAIFDRAAQKMAATVNSAPLNDDALRVAVCGSSAPLPSASRAKACVAVFAGGKFYVVDTGPESTENLVLWGIPLSKIGAVLLTHFHSDHIGDLGELNLQTWAGGRATPLTVYGGPGIERVVAGFNDAYRMDQGYRTTHHGEDIMPSATWPMIARTVELDGPATPAKSRSAIVLDEGGLRITAIEVNHAPIEPAYAYRFDYKGRSVVITGDLKYHPPLAAAARDADVLVSEAIATNMTRSLGSAATSAGRKGTAAIMHDIEDYHITPEEAARIANDANVKLLVYYHLLPAPDGALPRRLFARGVNSVRPKGWTIADDGSMYTLPIGSTDIRLGRIDE
ncbi:MAG: MBL fold metallo-hydrolase [Gemmatimonadota bacterium]